MAPATPRTTVDRSTLEVLKQRLEADLEADGAAPSPVVAPAADADAETPLPRRARGR